MLESVSTERALLEISKFLPLKDAFLCFQLTCKRWRRVVLKEESIINYLPDDISDKWLSSLPLYDRLKALNSKPENHGYLLHMSNSVGKVWNLSSDSTMEVHSSVFLNSARYVLDSKVTAVVTGGVGRYQSCVSVHLITGAVTPMSGLCQKRAWHGITIMNKELYVSGGSVKDGKYENSAEKYSNGRWIRISPMVTPRYLHTLTSFRKQIYAFGGSNSECLSSIEIFDGFNWTLLPLTLPTARNYPSIIRDSMAIMLIGGYSLGARDYMAYIWLPQDNHWIKVGTTEADYSMSNAVALRGNTIYFYNHTKDQFKITLQ